MRSKFSVLVIIFLLLTCPRLAFAQRAIEHYPSETSVLKLPSAKWKEIARSVTEKEGTVEFIPSNQVCTNWSDLINIMFNEKSVWDPENKISAEMFVENFRKTLLSSFPKDKATMNIIENDKEKNAVTYEWILHKAHKDVPAQHEIARYYVTEKGIHRVAYTSKKVPLSAEERQKWIDSLRESVSVMSFEEAANTSEGLSLVERLKDTVDLGAVFRDWNVLRDFRTNIGYTHIVYISPTQPKDSYLESCLEIITMPQKMRLSSEEFLTQLKEVVEERSSKQGQIQYIKKTPREIIYSYSYSKDHLIHNMIVRTLQTDSGYYSFSYRHGLPKKMDQEEILKWKEKLEQIKII